MTQPTFFEPEDDEERGPLDGFGPGPDVVRLLGSDLSPFDIALALQSDPPPASPAHTRSQPAEVREGCGVRRSSDETPRLRIHRADRTHRLYEAYASALARVARAQSLLEGWNFQVTIDPRHHRVKVLGFPKEMKLVRRVAIDHLHMARETLRDHERFVDVSRKLRMPETIPFTDEDGGAA